MGKRLLLISYLLPPAGGVGVQRPLSYLRYLPACGCRMVTLTARNPVTPVYDPSLAARIPEGMPIYRVTTFELPSQVPQRDLAPGSEGREGAIRGCRAALFRRLEKAILGMLNAWRFPIRKRPGARWQCERPPGLSKGRRSTR